MSIRIRVALAVTAAFVLSSVGIAPAGALTAPHGATAEVTGVMEYWWPLSLTPANNRWDVLLSGPAVTSTGSLSSVVCNLHGIGSESLAAAIGSFDGDCSGGGFPFMTCGGGSYARSYTLFALGITCAWADSNHVLHWVDLKASLVWSGTPGSMTAAVVGTLTLADALV
jgi:hypothetical protein